MNPYSYIEIGILNIFSIDLDIPQTHHTRHCGQQPELSQSTFFENTNFGTPFGLDGYCARKTPEYWNEMDSPLSLASAILNFPNGTWLFHQLERENSWYHRPRVHRNLCIYWVTGFYESYAIRAIPLAKLIRQMLLMSVWTHTVHATNIFESLGPSHI